MDQDIVEIINRKILRDSQDPYELEEILIPKDKFWKMD
jgi:hypothetical protein